MRHQRFAQAVEFIEFGSQRLGQMLGDLVDLARYIADLLRHDGKSPSGITGVGGLNKRVGREHPRHPRD